MPLSIEEVKKIPPKTLLKMINRAKKFLKTNDVIKKICDEYDLDTSIIDAIPIRFGDIDVSAKTNRGVIILNYKLLCDGDFLNDYHYLCHEIKHYIDQCFGDEATLGADDGDYLHNPDEQAGFQVQVEYIDDMYGDKEADNYVEHLLDHHDKDGKERKELKDKLMDKVDD